MHTARLTAREGPQYKTEGATDIRRGKKTMPDIQLVLTAEEQEYLVRILEAALKGDRVEMAHTDARAYKEQVKREIALVETLLAKVQKAS
jgi:hypothetical protein